MKTATEIEAVPAELSDVVERLRQDGVKVLAAYQEPVGNHWHLFVLIPVEKVEAAPFQRDLSPYHVRDLQMAMAKVGRYIDPITLVYTREGKYWTPNGWHRTVAVRQMGLEYIPAVLIPEEDVLQYILSLNVEKAPNLRDKALEVIRLYKRIIEERGDASPTETELREAFEEAYYITLGVIYEKEARFSGSAYRPLLSRIDDFIPEPLSVAIHERERRAQILKELDEEVNQVVQKLQERGINHPFLKSYVVSKNNPYKRKRSVVVPFDEGIQEFRNMLRTFDVASVTEQDVITYGDYE